MSLRRAIKAYGIKDFMQMGLAIATSRKIDPPAPPDNEDQRRVKVAQTGIVGQDLASQFEIFGDVVRLITSADQVMINILDGENMFTIGGCGVPVDPLMGLPQDMSMCQFALTSPEPFLVPDMSKDDRFAGTPFTKPPMNATAYVGFPLCTTEGVVLGTLCAMHTEPLHLSDEQVRLMRQLAKAVTDQIEYRAEQANLTASRIGAMLGRFVRFAPDGTITELMGFLDFCAQGTSTPEILAMLAREGVIAQRSDSWMLTQDGIDLKAELGLASEGYLGSQARQTAVGGGLDDLLAQVE